VGVRDHRRDFVHRDPADLRAAVGDHQKAAIDREMPPVGGDFDNAPDHGTLAL
jgi:hypothetical protein